MKTSKIIIAELPRYLSKLEQEIRASKSISPQKYTQIHQELDLALEALKKSAAVTANPLKDRIVTLCGELENRIEQDQLLAIQKTAEQLSLLMENYQKDHLPSLADKRILTQARKLLSSAHLQKSPIPHFSSSIAEKPVEEEDLDFSLLEMARAVYNNNMKEAKKIYLSLPETFQEKFQNHMRNLLATPFDDVKETLQALTLMSGALTPISTTSEYPSQEQIDLFFIGLSQQEIPKKQSTGKIIKFDQNG